MESNVSGHVDCHVCPRPQRMADDNEATGPQADDEPFDAEKSLAWLREKGVEIETVEDRENKKKAATLAADSSESLPFAYVKIPAERTEAVSEHTGRYLLGGGDILTSLLSPRFADDGVLDTDVVARETAKTMKGMMIGGSGTLGGKTLQAPSAQSLQEQARGGSCEAWPLAQPNEENDYRAVRLYIDEVGALRMRPRNERAEALAAACGLHGVSLHGDAYVGRCSRAPLGGERNDSFTLADLDHESEWVRIARKSHTERAQQLDLTDSAHLASGGDAVADGFTWTQTEDDLEVRVTKGLPADLSGAAKKKLSVSYGKGASLTVKFDGKEVLSMPKLFDRVAPDECSWSIEKGKGDAPPTLVIQMEKVSSRAWDELELPGFTP